MMQGLRLLNVIKSFKMGLSKRLVWRIVFIAGLSAVINGVQFYFFYSQTLQILAEKLSFQLLPQEFYAVAQSMPSMYEAMSDWLVGLLVLQLTLAIWAGCWLSYRLYGPVERIRTALVDISLGKLATVITTRKGDELEEIAQDINDSSARIQVMIMGMKESLKLLEQCDIPADKAAHLETIRANLEYFETVEIDYGGKQSNP